MQAIETAECLQKERELGSFTDNGDNSNENAKKKPSFDKYNVLVSHSMTMKMPSFMCYEGHK